MERGKTNVKSFFFKLITALQIFGSVSKYLLCSFHIDTLISFLVFPSVFAHSYISMSFFQQMLLFHFHFISPFFSFYFCHFIFYSFLCFSHFLSPPLPSLSFSLCISLLSNSFFLNRLTGL